MAADRNGTFVLLAVGVQVVGKPTTMGKACACTASPLLMHRIHAGPVEVYRCRQHSWNSWSVAWRTGSKASTSKVVFNFLLCSRHSDVLVNQESRDCPWPPKIACFSFKRGFAVMLLPVAYIGRPQPDLHVYNA